MENKSVEVKLFENDINYKSVSIANLLDVIKSTKICSIKVGSEDYSRGQNEIVKIVETDYDNPLVLKKKEDSDEYTLIVNINWCLDNKKLIEDLILSIAQNTKSEKFNILSSVLINPKIVDSLCSNPVLKEVSLGKNLLYGYTLSYEDYLKFKKSGITRVYSSTVSDELKNNFDTLIGYNRTKKLISFYNYDDLNQPDKVLNILNDLNEEEIDNLKYLGDASIRLEGTIINNIGNITKRLKELNKKNKIVVKVRDNKEFNSFMLNSNIDYENIHINIDLVEIPLNHYLRVRKILRKIIEPAIDFSPFEKFIYAYNIVKKYKNYKENDNNRMSARNIYDILENEYMVCVGFSSFLGELCDMLGIETIPLSAVVDTSYDEVDKEDNIDISIQASAGFHARRYVHLQDDKYGIDGYYVSDPTWDNDNDFDFYNYMIMTDDESTHSKRYLMMLEPSTQELFNVESIDDFYSKLKFILNRSLDSHSGFRKTSINDELIDFVYEFVKKIKKLDFSFFEHLKSAYPYIINEKYKWPDEVADVLNEIAFHIVSKVNKVVSGKTIMDAVYNVYSMTNIFGTKTDEEFNRTLEVNKKRQEKCFPHRVKKYDDFTIEEYENSINKFDLNYNEKSI